MLRNRVKEHAASALEGLPGTIESIEILDDQHTDEGIVSQHLDLVIKFKEKDISPLKLFAKVSGDKSLLKKVSDEDYKKLCYMENLFYVSVAPPLHKIACANGIKLSIPKCYSSVNENGSTLVLLEHLKDKGYSLFPPVEEDALLVDEKGLCKVLTELGKLQGLALLQSHQLEVPLRELYPVLHDWHDFVKKLLTSKGIKEKFKRVIPKFAEPRQAEILSRFADFGEEVFDQILNSSINCVSLLHNDMWKNNILQRDEEVILLDFQCWSIGPVAIDIAQWLFFSAPTDAMKPEALKKYLEVYLEGVKEPWTAAGQNLPENWTVENLAADFHKCAPMSIITTYLNGAYVIFDLPNLEKEFLLRPNDACVRIMELFLDQKIKKEIFK